MGTEVTEVDASSAPVYVVFGGDLIVATSNEQVADTQYTVMIGANLDAERLKLTPERWVAVRATLAADNPEITITDLTTEEQENAGAGPR